MVSEYEDCWTRGFEGRDDAHFTICEGRHEYTPEIYKSQVCTYSSELRHTSCCKWSVGQHTHLQGTLIFFFFHIIFLRHNSQRDDYHLVFIPACGYLLPVCIYLPQHCLMEEQTNLNPAYDRGRHAQRRPKTRTFQRPIINTPSMYIFTLHWPVSQKPFSLDAHPWPASPCMNINTSTQHKEGLRWDRRWSAIRACPREAGKDTGRSGDEHGYVTPHSKHLALTSWPGNIYTVLLLNILTLKPTRFIRLSEELWVFSSVFFFFLLCRLSLLLPHERVLNMT